LPLQKKVLKKVILILIDDNADFARLIKYSEIFKLEEKNIVTHYVVVKATEDLHFYQLITFADKIISVFILAPQLFSIIYLLNNTELLFFRLS
jgi:hypothetical protein